MSEKAKEVIADAISYPLPIKDSHFERATRYVAALKAAGIALVELPEPTARWDGEPMAWTVDGDGYVEVRKTDGHIGQVMVSNPISGPDEARRLAAALLAAADAAEAVR